MMSTLKLSKCIHDYGTGNSDPVCNLTCNKDSLISIQF